MDNRNFQSAASASPPTAPASPSNGYPTNGNPTTGTPATQLGAHWFHKIGEELRAIITGAGIAPADSDLSQVSKAIQSGGLWMGVSGGTADVITATFTPGIAALTNGMSLNVRAGLANATTTPTFTPNSGTIAAKAIVKGNGLALAAGDIAGAGHWIELQYDLTLDKWVLLNPANGVAPAIVKQIQPITASVATNALTCTLNPTSLDFRSSTLTSGAVNTRVIGSAISVVVPSGASLATIAAQTSRLAVLAIDNAGTVELAVTNIAGGDNLDETTLLTTIPIAQTCTFTGSIAVTTGILTLSATGTGTFALGQAITGTGVASGTYIKSLLTGTLGAAASTYQTNQFTAVASTTITGVAGLGVYSATARSSVPFRVVGYVESTQATAGTWATAPSTLQGSGGQALAAMSSLGYGQTWQDVTTSRSTATIYYNITGKPIVWKVVSASTNVAMVVNGLTISSPANAINSELSAIIPPGGSYMATATITKWFELR